MEKQSRNHGGNDGLGPALFVSKLEVVCLS